MEIYSSSDGWYTLYEPRSGMPVSVPKDSLDICLSQGFTRYPPGSPPKPSIPTDPVSITDASASAPAVKDNNDAIVLVNSASLGDIRGLGLSTAQAKMTKDRRPYESLEDLVIKVPEVTFWGELEPFLDFSV